MIWDIVEKKDSDDDKEWGYPRRVLKGMIFLIIIIN
jgi:hypothetical protein